MPGGPEKPVLGGIKFGFPPSPPHSTGTVAGTVDQIGLVLSGTSSLSATVGGVKLRFSVTFAGTSSFSVTPFGSAVFNTAGTYSWTCPPGVHAVRVECYGGGGGGGGTGINQGGGGGGGGAFAARNAVPVTPGTTYTVVVGAGGVRDSHNGGSSTFTGDSGVQVIAVGGTGGVADALGAGGSAASSTGDTGLKFSGGAGGAGVNGPGQSGGGGGASGNKLATGAAGGASIGGGSPTGPAGGTGANGGGSGGSGGVYNTSNGSPGVTPGGGAGGGGGFFSGGIGADGSVYIRLSGVFPVFQGKGTLSPTLRALHRFSFSVSGTSSLSVAVRGLHRFTASFAGTSSFLATISKGNLKRFTLTIAGTSSLVIALRNNEIDLPFIASKTHVWSLFSLFNPNYTGGGPGNGGEVFGIRLNSNGTTTTATLTAGIGTSDVYLTLTGSGGMPTSNPFVVTIDSEQIVVVPQSAGGYGIRMRGAGNTTPASHSAGATVTWNDSYYMPINAADNINANFTANIEGTGSFLYNGWLMAFDCTQAYLSDGSRFTFNVTEFMGVFAAGAGISGTNKCDGAQPSAIHAPQVASDHCGAGLTNPALVTTNVVPGDVAVVRFQNPTASVLDLGPRSVAVQSWYGMKRVDTTDHDVTNTNPNGIVIDTTGTYGTFTGSATKEPDKPLALATGIAPDISDSTGSAVNTPTPVPWLTVNLPGTDRFFTYGPPDYSERGWPIGVVTVRQGNRRVPIWTSWDWHDFSWVYNGFGSDCSFAQVVINQNGMTGVLPTLSLPGPQDIAGPDAIWDDATYYFGTSWYVAIVATPYLVVGPPVGGTSGPTGPFSTVPTPTVTFPGGVPTIGPPNIQGGTGGGITPPIGDLHVWHRA